MKNRYPNSERKVHHCLNCGSEFLTPFRAATICPNCERAIERADSSIAAHPAGTGGRRNPRAKRVTRVVSGGLPELGKKRR
jgi:hypothetical protein